MAGQPQVDVGAILANQMLQAAKVVEEQIDREMEQLEKLDEDSLEALKQRRLKALKKAQEQKQEWIAQGHGEYQEIPEEKEFFNVTKNSSNVVVLFYRDDFFRCKIVDKHMSKYSPTKYFPFSEPQNPSIDVSEVNKIWQTTDLRL